ncbi:MAG: AAA family ATPase [Syntrophobacterales bacterium]|nr:AAA family ATPase [Syntrophobacterales bacterium]
MAIIVFANRDDICHIEHMISDNLKYVIRQFVERVLPACKPRELVIPTGTGKVVGLAGVRRSGKTFLFFDAIQRLALQRVDRRRIMYLNFEDDRLGAVDTPPLRHGRRGGVHHRSLFAVADARPGHGLAGPQHYPGSVPALFPGISDVPGDRGRAAQRRQ